MNKIIFIYFALTLYFNSPVQQSAVLPQSMLKTYKINFDQSKSISLVHKAEIVSAFGHNHGIKAGQSKGAIKFDKNLLLSSSV
jgi:hypothetical protein